MIIKVTRLCRGGGGVDSEVCVLHLSTIRNVREIKSTNEKTNHNIMFGKTRIVNDYMIRDILFFVKSNNVLYNRKTEETTPW